MSNYVDLYSRRIAEKTQLPGADLGVFLGEGVPLRDSVTNTNKPHFFAEYQLHKKAVGHLGGGVVCTPAPSP